MRLEGCLVGVAGANAQKALALSGLHPTPFTLHHSSRNLKVFVCEKERVSE